MNRLIKFIVKDCSRLLTKSSRRHSSLTTAIKRLASAQPRKCCALLLFIPVASDAARLLRHGGLRQKAAMCAADKET